MEYSKITGMMKNVLLAAVNAKYIHSNLAVYSLQRYAGQRIPGGMDRIGIAEYTINQQAETILADLFRRAPEVLCFSCYIWNMDMVARLLDTSTWARNCSCPPSSINNPLQSCTSSSAML